MRRFAYEISRAALNLAFPIFCQGCGKNLPYKKKIYLCRDCFEKLKLSSPSHRTLADENSFFKQAWHCYAYEGFIKELVRKFKYQKKLYLKNTLAKLLYEFIISYMQYKDINIIIAVPMHISDERKRGFNQSDILAKELSLLLNVAYGKKSILKYKQTRKQMELKRTDRLKNLKDVFAPGDTTTFNGKNALLIDDVFTTGTTTNECSRTLMKYGANSVSVLTLTKGL